MKVLAVIAHPKKDGLVRAAFDAVIDQLRRRGCVVDILDLYERATEIPYYEFPADQNNPGSGLEKYPFFHENKERFMSADRLIVAYPIWWYATPGIMKNWLDCITNYAFSYNGTNRAVAKHSIKKVLIINTSDMSYLYKLCMTRNSGTEMMRQSFYFLGVEKTRALELSTRDFFGRKKKALDYDKLTQQASSAGLWLCS
ncbi:flavodoxin family protein [bacterium]|nr:flavodoxin family protein [bacterium]